MEILSYYTLTQWLLILIASFIIGMGKGYRPEAGQDAGGQVFRWTGTKMVQLQESCMEQTDSSSKQQKGLALYSTCRTSGIARKQEEEPLNE